jgi:crotonobetainyl-CoA:carnitine CoA-transferase CaiB-like acyl-CoA transferase
MAHFNLDDFTHLLSADQVMGPFSRPHVSQSYVFECGDGGWIALHMSSPVKFWENLAQAVGLPDLLERPEFVDRDARIANYDAVVATLAPIFVTRPRDDWAAQLTALEVPNSPMLTSREVLDSDQARHLGLMVEADGPHGRFRTIRSPLSFDGERETRVSAPPVIGQHNHEILGRAPAFEAAG